MRPALLLFTLAPCAFICAPLCAGSAQTRPDSVAARRDSVATRRDSAAALERVTVSAIRARNEAPISAKTIDAAEIDRRSFGQDVPLLLQGTPSLTAYSETGNYWGYSYFRMRGIDQSRINLTLDGIPLNDPEDQLLYFADFPDLANSVTSIQVQRGVGTSAPGTASYGGSINLETVPLVNSSRSAQMQLQGGSFGSARASAEYTSGLLPGGASVYGRLSALQSSGYRRHSGMEGRSAFLSAAHVGQRHLVKLTAIAGLFADTLSYVGATTEELARDRRFNPLRPDEVDRFGEQVVALAYTRHLTSRSSLSATAYRLSAGGRYDVCIALCDQPQGDLWNFNLGFVWYGATTVWTRVGERARVSIGGNANTYARDHHAYARTDPLVPLYFNTGHKDDASVFAKVAYDIGAVTLFGDLQGRHAEFAYTPDVNAGIGRRAIGWNFLNPKVGATLHVSPTASVYGSLGINAREPARGDMFGGFDNLDTTNADFVGPLSRVRAERVRDVEAGFRYRGRAWGFDANAFAMEFHDEILPVGRLSYIGTPLRTNVRGSWRRGLEADVTARPAAGIEVALTATGMRARIGTFTDDETGQVYRHVEPLLTPKLVSSQRVTMKVTRSVSITASGMYTGHSQLSNTGDAALTLPSHYVVDLSADWQNSGGVHGLTIHLNNATNSRGYSGGHVSSGVARYYVLPPLNFFLLAKLGT